MVVMAVLASDDSAGDGVVVGRGLVRGGEGRVMLVHRIVMEH